jgi:tight adherence protein C
MKWSLFFIGWILSFSIFVWLFIRIEKYWANNDLKKRIQRATLSSFSNDARTVEDIAKRSVNTKERDKKRSIIQKKEINEGKKTDNIEDLYAQAGWYKNDPKRVTIIGTLVFSLLGLAIGLVITLFTPLPNYIPNVIPITQKKIIIVIFCVLLASQQFERYVHGRVENRLSRVSRGLPQALDLMVVCMQSGMPLHRSLERVAKETVKTNVDMGYELGITSLELEFILDQRQVLLNLSKRVPTPSMKTFITAVIQSIEQGSPLLKTLESLSKEIREFQITLAEKKAASIPGKMTIILVTCILPTLLIVLGGPMVHKFTSSNGGM